MGADQERNVEEVYNIRTFSSLDEALAEKPDIAYVCNPSSLHVAVTRACLIAGCDIFLEKPLFIIPRGQPVPGAEEVRFPTGDGLPLHGFYLKAPVPRRGVILRRGRTQPPRLRQEST